MNDIFEPVIRKLTQEIAQHLPDVPGDLKKSSRPAKIDSANAAQPSSEAGLGIADGPLGAITGRVSRAVGSFVGLFTHCSASSHGDDKKD